MNPRPVVSNQFAGTGGKSVPRFFDEVASREARLKAMKSRGELVAHQVPACVIYLGRQDLADQRLLHIGPSAFGSCMVVPFGRRAAEFRWPELDEGLTITPRVAVWCDRLRNLSDARAFAAELVRVAYGRVWLFCDSATDSFFEEYRAA